MVNRYKNEPLIIRLIFYAETERFADTAAGTFLHFIKMTEKSFSSLTHMKQFMCSSRFRRALAETERFELSRPIKACLLSKEVR